MIIRQALYFTTEGTICLTTDTASSEILLIYNLIAYKYIINLYNYINLITDYFILFINIQVLFWAKK